MKFEQSVTLLIRQRKSVRNYLPKAFDPSLESQIREILASHTKGPMGNEVTFHLVKEKKDNDGGKVKIGTYGFIKGARYFIAGEVREGRFFNEDYGFLLEKVMLHMLEAGLGTCWLGGTFSRSEFSQIIGADKDLLIPAVTPVGFPADKMSTRERLIRRGAGSDRRKPWRELFFEDSFEKPLEYDEENETHLPLEMVRLGPSASNKQPWRIVKSGRIYQFILERTPGYGSFAKNVDLQRIDMGIAMAHFELTAKEIGMDGRWEVLDPDIELKNEMEYIISWVQE